MRFKLGGSVFLVLLVSCASHLLAPDRERQVEFLEKTTVKRGTAYGRALRWFDRNLRFVPEAARSQDEESGKMRMEAAFSCNVFRKESDLKDYFLTFELEFESQPGFIHLHFTQLRMENTEGQLVTKPEAQLSSPQNMERIRPCLKKKVAALMKAVESDTPTW